MAKVLHMNRKKEPEPAPIMSLSITRNPSPWQTAVRITAGRECINVYLNDDDSLSVYFNGNYMGLVENRDAYVEPIIIGETA